MNNNMNFNDMMNMLSKMDKNQLQAMMNQAQSIVNANGGPQAFMNNLNNNSCQNNNNCNFKKF